MHDLLDTILIGRDDEVDDESLTFEHARGDAASNVVYFLPWRTTIALARRFGLMPRQFLLCYELPLAIAGSRPELCREAMRRVVEHAHNELQALGRAGADVVMVGASLGSAPATFLANQYAARLCSVVSADRGDLMLWQSPAVSAVKARAVSRGATMADFATATRGMHPVDNLAHIAPSSIFVVSKCDLFVPTERRDRLIEAVQRQVPTATIRWSETGHIRTIMETMRVLPELLSGDEQGGSGTGEPHRIPA